MFNQICVSFVLSFHFKGIPGIRGSPGVPGPPGVEVKRMTLNLHV